MGLTYVIYVIYVKIVTKLWIAAPAASIQKTEMTHNHQTNLNYDALLVVVLYLPSAFPVVVPT